MPRLRLVRTIQVRGLVKTMNDVRASLASGEQPAESTALREQIARALELADQACRAAGRTPRNLPPPSRRAYQFLAGLDLRQSPALQKPLDLRPQRISLSKLVNIRRAIQGELDSLAQDNRETSSPARMGDGALRDLRNRVQDLAAEVAVQCDRAGTGPGSLPDPSRRVYQWLSFLAHGDRLVEHVSTLHRALAVDERVKVELFHLAGLYRAAPRGEGTRLVLSEGFVGSPDDVLLALVKVVLPHTHKRRHRAVINAYVDGVAFQDTILSLELSGGAFEPRPKGRLYDLDEIFSDLNASFFGGKLVKPRLSWNQTITHRDFGHYEPSADTIMISITLDSPEVPRFVTEYVVHHELLHKDLGVRRVDGRRQVHTRQFRDRERHFPRAAEAEAFLEAWARHLRRS
jgi:hypothetical protein